MIRHGRHSREHCSGLVCAARTSSSFQTLAPEEISFSFRNPSMVKGLESLTDRLSVGPGSLRRHDRDQFEGFMHQLRKRTVEMNGDFVTLSSDRHLENRLACYIRVPMYGMLTTETPTRWPYLAREASTACCP